MYLARIFKFSMLPVDGDLIFLSNEENSRGGRRIELNPFSERRNKSEADMTKPISENAAEPFDRRRNSSIWRRGSMSREVKRKEASTLRYLGSFLVSGLRNLRKFGHAEVCLSRNWKWFSCFNSFRSVRFYSSLTYDSLQTYVREGIKILQPHTRL